MARYKAKNRGATRKATSAGKQHQQIKRLYASLGTLSNAKNALEQEARTGTTAQRNKAALKNYSKKPK